MSTLSEHLKGEAHAAENKTRISKGLSVPWRKVGFYVGFALIFFLLGAIPMWLKSRENARQRNLAQHELRLSQLQNTLSSAVIDARRGDYEPARQTASDFFTDLRNGLDTSGDQSLFASDQQQILKPLLSQRDDIITLLARSDPASAERLSNLYIAYRKAMNGVYRTSNRRESKVAFDKLPTIS